MTIGLTLSMKTPSGFVSGSDIPMMNSSSGSQTIGIRETNVQDKRFAYKGHRLEIEIECDDDCRKAFHFAYCPDGIRRFADITPYDFSEQTFRLWVDAGYPKRIGCGPLHRDDIEKILEEQTKLPQVEIDN